MIQDQSKYNIAWFKLAEFVIRKEKERALAIYRLLAHSLPDQALASQLEGDIFFSFSDEKAIVSYNKAAHLYKNNKQYIQAAAIYEHLLSILPNNYEFIFKIIELYQILNNEIKLNLYISLHIKKIVKNNDLEQLSQLLEAIDSKSKIFALQELVCELLYIKTEESKIDYYTNMALDLINRHDETQITKFLIKIKNIDTLYYNNIVNLLELKV